MSVETMSDLAGWHVPIHPFDGPVSGCRTRLAAPHSAAVTPEQRIAELEHDNARLRRNNASLLVALGPTGGSALPRGMTSLAAFEREVEREWARAAHVWAPLSIVSLNLNGTSAELAAEIAAVVTNAVRAFDTVCIAESSVWVLLPQTNRTGADAFTSRLRESLWLQGISAPAAGAAVAFDDAAAPAELMTLAASAASADRPDASSAVDTISPRDTDISDLAEAGVQQFDTISPNRWLHDDACHATIGA